MYAARDAPHGVAGAAEMPERKKDQGKEVRGEENQGEGDFV
jgi:hypothetical protein